jgi:hypothetical protein
MTTGENIGAAVDATVAQTEANAADAIAQAQANADASAREAQRIADAAIATELGQRIESQSREQAAWQTAADQRLTEVMATNQRLEAQFQETTGLLGSIRALLTPTPTPAATPAPAMVPTDASSTGTAANAHHEGAAAETHPEPPRRKRHFL